MQAPDLTTPEAVAKYAAEAANRERASAPGLHGDGPGMLQDPRLYANTYQDATRHLSAADMDLLPNPGKIASMATPKAGLSSEPMRIEVGDSGVPQGFPPGDQALPTPAPAKGQGRGAAYPPPQVPPPPAPVGVPPETWHQDDSSQPPYPFPAPFPPPNGGMPPFQMPLMWPTHHQYMQQMQGYSMPPYMDPQAMAKGGQMPFPMMPPYGMYPPMGMPQDGAQRGEKGAARAKSASKKARSKERRKRGRAKGREKTPPPQDADDTANVSAALKKVILEGAKCRMPMEEVRGHVVEFAMHQHGSKFLQAKLDDSQASEDDKRLILEEALAAAPDLAKHTYGNHFIQKLFEKVSMDQRKEIVNKLQGHILSLTMDTSGCRVIQKALHLVSRNSQLSLANELRKNVHECISHMHGNHVIQKCIEQMPPDSVNFIIQAVEEKVYETASHMYGCRVIQRLLEHCQSQQLSKIQQEIVEKAQSLSQDAYGNYVVQHVLEHGRKDDKQKIIVQVTTNLIEFSKNKHSSNVVEKCFEFATCGEHSAQLAEERQALMQAVLGIPGDPNAPICMMMNDKFGNYIVQRVIEYCKGPEKEILRKQIMSQEGNLRNNANGKHIISAAQKEFGESLFATAPIS
mmetsp:Transcript_44863/g.106438  ORF Transcript_44863/g.106438 Transcript_44863/m.106438 type:complete len:629 (-) Transcript_44863:398-2284(-)